MGRVIAVANQKGGVGKTTTAVNIAASIAALDHRCLLIDMDPQANATSGLGLKDSGSTRPSVYDAIVSDVPLRDLYLPTELKHLSLVPASRSLTDDDRFYVWHRWYLISATVQWLAGMVHLVTLIGKPDHNPQGAPSG